MHFPIHGEKFKMRLMSLTILDPRFPGGTSSAVAQELKVIAQSVRPKIFGFSSGLFKGKQVAPQLELALRELGLSIEWDPPSIAADIVILHNPAFLKFQSSLDVRVVAKRLYVVAHENFNRPGGASSFDVNNCLGLIDRSVLAMEKFIAPISELNRSTVDIWMAGSEQANNWQVLQGNWFNICDFEVQEPCDAPRDRRGRLSRAGYEKFPPLNDLELCFPKHAECNIMLGADCLLDVAADYPHWDILQFASIGVPDFFEKIDFFVYYIAPTLQESFGRVVVEAIAAGKLVITDAATASGFDGAVIASNAQNVSGVIAHYIDNPAEYKNQVLLAQSVLGRFSGPEFDDFFEKNVLRIEGST